jgi:hypothetical protein
MAGMVTWANLLLKLLTAILDARDDLAKLEKDTRHKIAERSDHVGRTLMEAWAAFEKGDHQVEKFREVAPHLSHFVEMIRGHVKDDKPIASLHAELQRAIQTERPSSWKSREQAIVHAIAIKPASGESPPDWHDNVVRGLSKPQLKMIVHHEQSSLRGASDLFKTVAVELRSSDPN